MYLPKYLPIEIKNKIIIDMIILLKNNNGWRQIHNRLKEDIYLRYVGSIFECTFKYYYIKRKYINIDYIII